MLVLTHKDSGAVVHTAPDDTPAAFGADGLMIGDTLFPWATPDAAVLHRDAPDPDVPLTGDTLYDGAVWSLRVEGLPTLRLRRVAEVERLKADKLAVGVVHNGHRFRLTAQDRTDIGGGVARAALALQGAADWPDNRVWIDADNALMPVPTAQAMVAFGLAVDAAYEAIVLRARQHKDALLSVGLVSVPAVRDYDIAAGW